MTSTANTTQANINIDNNSMIGLMVGLFFSGFVFGVLVSTVSFCILRYRQNKRLTDSHGNRARERKDNDTIEIDISCTSDTPRLPLGEREITELTDPYEHVPVTVPMNSSAYESIDSLSVPTTVPTDDLEKQNDSKLRSQTIMENNTGNEPLYHILEKTELNVQEPVAARTTKHEYFILLKQEDPKVTCKDIMTLPDYLTLENKEPTQTAKEEINSNVCIRGNTADQFSINDRQLIEDNCIRNSDEQMTHANCNGNELPNMQENQEAPIASTKLDPRSKAISDAKAPPYSIRAIASGFLASRRMNNWTSVSKKYNLGDRQKYLKHAPASHKIFGEMISHSGEKKIVKQIYSQSQMTVDSGNATIALKRGNAGRVRRIVNSFKDRKDKTNVQPKRLLQRNVNDVTKSLSIVSKETRSSNNKDTAASSASEAGELRRAPTYVNAKTVELVANMEVEQKTVKFKEQPDSSGKISLQNTGDSSIRSPPYMNVAFK